MVIVLRLLTKSIASRVRQTNLLLKYVTVIETIGMVIHSSLFYGKYRIV